ncbi:MULTISPECIES: hypothetical protein [Oceanospirillaceae]|jgi:hypothetical protein|uniref:hypothetical protein n=1 Tax=Oceanospirillaceae TaxID=135620 RepID=UPI000C599FD7|nr:MULTISPECIES: hypothetical protein [Thalassolituus]MAY14569.1 hypothetical protein [Oceanospirillaceae bacterium]MCA6059640.1 hypothetical protein [Thalassolituus sp. ST750PaO-4]MCB2385441.1 hypothetical protein [Thalassolituus alkanivorans]MCB2423303.1 hypothetical protein [Thalassolituus alkanivorans]TVV43319.1 hypothetical protein FOT50_12870 [Thalassolituus sp. C2-1]|tara:strand:+ start:390 stop:677 length:288 start_codon:yes stop_codon:yes gene_type:complete
MSQTQKLSLIQPLVEHMMQTQDVAEWRQALLNQGIMSKEEVIALDQNALHAAYKTFKIMQLLNEHPDHIMNEIERNKVCWKLDFSYDYHQGAVCY